MTVNANLIQSLLAMLPLLIVSATAVVVMLSIAFARNHWWNATVTVVGLNLALISLIFTVTAIPREVTPMLMIDGYAAFYMGFVLVTALACATLLHAYMEDFDRNREEVYLLLVLSALGGMVLACAQHMASFFIGLELLSVPIYGMIAYTFTNRHALEGGIKYTILSGVASAFLLFGMALVYAHTGNLGFNEISQALGEISLQQPLLLAGSVMIMVAIAFKLSMVPFHLWTPDVYQGAPSPVAAYLSTGSKVAGFAVLMRFLLVADAQAQPMIENIIIAMAFVSMLGGSFLALLQSNIKRLLAYSAIAHMGYVLLGIAAGTQLESETVLFYLITYVTSTLAAFGVVALMSTAGKNGDTESLHSYRGLFWRRPYLTAIMTVSMLSLAGIPLTAGFIGKFYIVWGGVDADLWWLLGALFFSTGMGLFYYFRVIVTMYMREPGMVQHDAEYNWGQRAGGLAMLGLTGLTLLIGIWPEPFIQVVRASGIAGL